MIKRVMGFVMIQLFVSSAFAISVRSNDTFQFNDQSGEQIAYLECGNLKYQDMIALNRIVKNAKESKVIIEGLIVKKQKAALMYSSDSGRASYEFETYRSACEVSLN